MSSTGSDLAQEEANVAREEEKLKLAIEKNVLLQLEHLKTHLQRFIEDKGGLGD